MRSSPAKLKITNRALNGLSTCVILRHDLPHPEKGPRRFDPARENHDAGGAAGRLFEPLAPAPSVPPGREGFP